MSKLVLLSAWQVNKPREELLWQGTATVFGKPVDLEDGRLLSQRTVLPGVDASFFYGTKRGRPGCQVKKEISCCKIFARCFLANVLISSFLKPFSDGPGQDVSCEFKQKYFSLVLRHVRQGSRRWAIMYTLR